MLRFIERLLGWRCCGEWTQWETHEARFSRPSNYAQDGVHHFSVARVEFTKRWQERKCTLCGKVQTRNLPYGN